MAGRFVILEFEAKDSAEFFLEKLRVSEDPDLEGAHVMAMFMRPDKFCECGTKRKQNVQDWAKGKRTGLYLCKRCKLPSIHHQQGIMSRLQYVFGYNQLPED